MKKYEKMRMETADITQQDVDKIAELFPNCVIESEDKEKSTPDQKVYKKVIDFNKLRQILSDDIVEGHEAYDFTWVGKKASILEANKPIRKTLRPCINESFNWDTTENLYIEGDNLEVLKLLRESYLNKVKMIYIDPPYNTGNDFIYKDDYSQTRDEYDEAIGAYDEDDNRLFKNTDSNGRFHSDWCSMIYPRLLLARDLLREDGVIFISIDDHEVANLRKICDEVFGEKNFVVQFVVTRSEGGGLAKQAVIGHDYCVVYAKNIEQFVPLGKPKDIRGEIVQINNEDYWIETDWLRKEFGKYGTCPYEQIVKYLGKEKKAEIDEGLKENKYVLIKKNNYHIVGRYRKVSEDSSKFYSVLKHLNKNGVHDLKHLGMEKYFDFPKPISFCREIILGTTIFNKQDASIILDFFSGSATTAHAVMQLNAEDGGNRKFIMVQLPEPCDEKSEAFKTGYKNICEIGKERIRRAGAKVKEEHPESVENLDVGFRVFKVDESNMKDVYFSPQEYNQDMLSDWESNIKSDRTDLDLLFGCLLESGVPLSMPYKSEKIDGYTVHTYGNGDQIPLIACFEENIPDSVIDIIAKRQPLRVVLRDSCFKDSVAKINMLERFKTFSPNTNVRVI